MNSVFFYVNYFLMSGLLIFVDSFDEKGNQNMDKWETSKTKIDDIRCFCNLPQCISTGYMCRTARTSINISGCFSEIREPNDLSTTRHGCVELLKNFDQRVQCDNSPRQHNNINSNNIKDLNTEMLLLCCHEDMCNHVDSPDNQKMKLDRTDNIDLLNPGKYQRINPNLDINTNNINVPMLPSPGISNNEDWFRVATIAVPICGAVILFSLIAVAIKILRSERISSQSSKLDSPNDFNRKIPSIDHETAQNLSTNFGRCSSSHHHHHQQQHLNHQYSSDNIICDKKNETRAKINQLINLEYCLLPQNGNLSDLVGGGGGGDRGSGGDSGINDPLIKTNNLEPSGSTNLCRNVNISLDKSFKKSNKDNNFLSNKIYEKEVLSPITANWNNISNSYKSYEI